MPTLALKCGRGCWNDTKRWSLAKYYHHTKFDIYQIVTEWKFFYLFYFILFSPTPSPHWDFAILRFIDLHFFLTCIQRRPCACNWFDCFLRVVRFNMLLLETFFSGPFNRRWQRSTYPPVGTMMVSLRMGLRRLRPGTSPPFSAVHDSFFQRATLQNSFRHSMSLLSSLDGQNKYMTRRLNDNADGDDPTTRMIMTT